MFAFLAVLAAAVIALVVLQEMDVECGSAPRRGGASVGLFDLRRNNLAEMTQAR